MGLNAKIVDKDDRVCYIIYNRKTRGILGVPSLYKNF